MERSQRARQERKRLPLTCRASGRDPIHQQHGTVHTGDSRFRAGRQIGTADRPVAIAQSHSSVPVVQALLEHDHLTDVTMTLAVASQRTVELALLVALLLPEVQAEYAAGKNDKPSHRGRVVRGVSAA